MTPHKKLRTSIFAPLGILLALGLSACPEPVAVDENGASATDADDLFPDEGTDTEAETTTTGGEPLDYCTLNPDATQEWMRYVCSGEFSVSLVFEYHGDPDVPLDGFIPCVDLSNGEAKEPTYVYTCFVMAYENDFGPDITNPYVDDIDTCCHPGAPGEHVKDFCEIDVAEETCRGLVAALNDLRKEIPKVGSGLEIYNQLTNLNKFIATNEAQTSCAKELAMELLADKDTPDWTPEVKDPAEEWPWFQALDFNLTELELNEPEMTDALCGEVFIGETIECDFDGELVINGPESTARTPVGGVVSVTQGPCWDGRCDIALNSFGFEVSDLDLGTMQANDARVALVRPAKGRASGPAVEFAGRELLFGADLTLTSDAPDQIPSGAISVSLSADGAVTGTLTDGQIMLDAISATSWPLRVELVNVHGTCL